MNYHFFKKFGYENNDWRKKGILTSIIQENIELLFLKISMKKEIIYKTEAYCSYYGTCCINRDILSCSFLDIALLLLDLFPLSLSLYYRAQELKSHLLCHQIHEPLGYYSSDSGRVTIYCSRLNKVRNFVTIIHFIH